MNKYLLLGVSLIIAGAILTAAGAICTAILDGMSDAYPLLIVFGILAFVAGILCFTVKSNYRE